MNKKVCAIVELGDHYKISLQSQLLLSKKYHCNHYIIKPENIEDITINSLLNGNIKVKRFENLLLLLWNLKKDSNHIDLIYFQGFVDNHTNRNRVLVSLFLLFNSIKTIVAIRNGFSYMPHKVQQYWCSYDSNDKSKIRKLITKALQYLRIRGNLLIFPLFDACVFETKTQLNFFKKNIFKRSKAKFGVIYDRYYIAKDRKEMNRNIDFSEKIIIGLLGSLCTSRRDYDLLIDSLKLLDKNLRKKLKFIALGNSISTSAPEIISQLQNKVELEIISPFLSEEEFETYGKACSFLLSPLKKDKPYGTLCGTGSFGDLVFLGRKLIIPKRVDPYGEFKFGSIYYDNSLDLKNIFKEIVLENKSGILQNRQLRPFSKEEVLRTLEYNDIF